MATKLVFADRILAAKGYEKPKFDTDGFNALVGKFFEEHDVNSTLLIKPRRFVEMSDAPTCGFIDYTDDSIWEKKVNDPNDPFNFTMFLFCKNKGLIRPMILVDEPEAKNAAMMLGIVNGFVVKKEKAGYIISLV